MRIRDGARAITTPAALALVALLGLALLPIPVPADTPSHAPAHGWRKKHDANYVGYTGRGWDRDYGVFLGRCNTEAIGAVLGGVVGGAVGSQVRKGDERAVAILVGSAAGAVIGARIGRDLDESDRACIGHALELTRDNRTVFWKNVATGTSFELTPTRGFEKGAASCREFTTRATVGVNTQVVQSVACRGDEGAWVFVR